MDLEQTFLIAKIIVCLNKNKSNIMKLKVLVTQSCPTLHDPMDWGLSGSSVHGILQTRILEWVSIPFSRN